LESLPTAHGQNAGASDKGTANPNGSEVAGYALREADHDRRGAQQRAPEQADSQQQACVAVPADRSDGERHAVPVSVHADARGYWLGDLCLHRSNPAA
jgi:hypothetical protein